MTTSRRSAQRWTWAALIVAAALAATTGVALAKWSSSGAGQARARAQTVNAGSQPAATVTGGSVALSWTASALTPGGQAVNAYVIRRYDSLGAEQVVGAGCAGTIAALTCTETNVPNGNWQYSVTPAVGNWRGTESARRSVTVVVPTVTSLSPNFAYPGTTQTVTVTGTNFVSGVTALFSGTGISITSTTFNSATQLTLNISVAAGATTGSRNLTATNPGGLGSGTCTACFTVPAGPTISSVNPNVRGQGATNQIITITGNHFVSGASVVISGTGVTVNSTTFNSATQLTANITVATTATVSARNVTVNNGGGFGSATCTGCFTVSVRPGTITLNPSSRGQGAVNQNIIVTGSNFVSGATVAFSGTGVTVNSTTFNSATQLTVNISVAAAATTGGRTVTVTNPDGGFNTATFTVNISPGPITLNVFSRGQGAANQAVVISGSNFVSGATVAFSGTGITVNSTTFNSAGQLNITISVASNATVGLRDVTITNPDGGARTTTGVFTVNVRPLPTSLSPASRARNTSGAHTITGSGFVSGATVTFSGTGITVNSANVTSATQITINITVALGATTGARNVTVTNADAGTGSCTGCFTVT